MASFVHICVEHLKNLKAQLNSSEMPLVIIELFSILPRPSFLVLHSDIFHRTCVFKMRDFSLLSLFCVLMERGIFCSNRLALERNKALLLDVFVVTLELHGIFSHESWEWKARGRSRAAFGFPPLLKGHLLVCFSFYGAYQAGLAQIVRAAK